MTSLKLARHSVTGKNIVEVYDDEGRFVATVYPSRDGSNTIQIISDYFDFTAGTPQDTVANIKDDYTLYGVHDVPGFRFKFRKE